MMIPEVEISSGRFTTLAESDPVLLTLPPRRGEKQPATAGENRDPRLERLHVIETESGPTVETALLTDLLARHLGLDQVLSDPVEVQLYHNPLASVNAYKHRLHALRCEYVNARMRIYELETQLDQSRYRVKELEKHVRFLDDTLGQMRESRGWRLVQKCSRWRRIVSEWFTGRSRASNSEN